MNKPKNQKPASNHKAVAYSRVAASVQKNPDRSIQTQQRSIFELAKSQGLEVTKWFVSCGGRPPTTADRLQEIVDYCKTNHINTLLVKSPDRISRSRSNYQAWQRKFKKAGVSVLSLADDVNAEQQWLNGEVERMHKEVVQELRLKAVRRKWGLKGNATK
jgi:DNA invertase Pin-like site-specific DNA recombinase